MDGKLEAVVKVTILSYFVKGKSYFSHGKVRDFKVDLLCDK